MTEDERLEELKEDEGEDVEAHRRRLADEAADATDDDEDDVEAHRRRA